jgi:hypothetical protein
MTRVLAVKAPLKAVTDGNTHDAVVLVSPAPSRTSLTPLVPYLRAAAEVDAKLDGVVSLLPAPRVAGGRLVVSPTGPLTRDHDDVRRWAEAARAGLRRARDAGAVRPLLVLEQHTGHSRYAYAPTVAALGAVGGLWEPLEAREALGERRRSSRCGRSEWRWSATAPSTRARPPGSRPPRPACASRAICAAPSPSAWRRPSSRRTCSRHSGACR